MVPKPTTVSPASLHTMPTASQMSASCEGTQVARGDTTSTNINDSALIPSLKAKKYSKGCEQIETLLRHLMASIERSGNRLEATLRSDLSQESESLSKKVKYLNQQILLETAKAHLLGVLHGVLEAKNSFEQLADKIEDLVEETDIVRKAR